MKPNPRNQKDTEKKRNEQLYGKKNKKTVKELKWDKVPKRKRNL